MDKVNSKKVIFVTPYFKPYMGGLENYVLNIVKGLSEIGWECVVITSNDQGKKYQECFVDGIKIYRLPTLFILSNTPINPFWFFYLRKIIKKEKPDIVNGHAPVPFIADMAAFAVGDIPFILTYHSGKMRKGKIIPDMLIWIYEKFLLVHTAHKAKKIICPSRFVISTLLKRFSKKAVVVTPGVDTSIFKPSDNEGYDKRIVLFIARFANMYKMKGLYYLIEAMKKLPNMTLRIIGEPVTMDANNIVFLGPKSIQETAREMQKCAMLVLPSIATMESFGMVLVEAMACKKPVIGTDIGGIPEVIRDGIDGIIVSPKDSDSLVKAINKIGNDTKLAKSMAEKGFEKVNNNFLWKNKIEETNREFLRILNN
jgi:glycosyltransferase involved in cell wall biosynthesis